MPGGDETGPWGRGPMTGRGAGYCTGYYSLESAGPGGRGSGRGFGRGMGYGRGMGRRFGYDEPVYHPANVAFPGRIYGPERPNISLEPSPEQEKAYLEDILKGMEAELDDIRKRIEELTKEE